MIEMDSHVRITLRCLDESRVECGAPDRVDALFGIDIVRRKMQIAGFIVDHASAHRNRVSQHVICDLNLFERVNPTRRNSEIDRASAYNVAFTRISPSLVKIDIVSAPAQVGGEQSAG